MANCLVTKLKSVVNNDNLPEMNKLKVKVTAKTSAAIVQFSKLQYGNNLTYAFSQPVNIKNEGGDILAESVTSYTQTIPTINVCPQVNVETIFTVDSKYDILSISTYSGSESITSIEFIGFDYLQTLRDVNLQNCAEVKGIENIGVLKNIDQEHASVITLRDMDSLTGNISSLSDCINLVNITIVGKMQSITGVGGDIESLSGCTNLRTLNIVLTDISGDGNAFLDALAASGRTTDLEFFAPANVTFAGKKTETSLNVIKFDGSGNWHVE